MAEWLSTKESATLLEVSESTMLRVLSDAATADAEFGPGNWRLKPLSRRRIYQVRRSAVEMRIQARPKP